MFFVSSMAKLSKTMHIRKIRWKYWRKIDICQIMTYFCFFNFFKIFSPFFPSFKKFQCKAKIDSLFCNNYSFFGIFCDFLNLKWARARTQSNQNHERVRTLFLGLRALARAQLILTSAPKLCISSTHYRIEFISF